MPINLWLDHPWIAILISTVVPPLLCVIIQYSRKVGRFRRGDLWDALAVGLVPAVLLLSLTVGVLNRELETLRAASQHSNSSQNAIPDQSIKLIRQEGFLEDAWNPHTIEQLMAKISGLTDEEREDAIENDLGLLIEVEGKVSDVSEYEVVDEISVRIEMGDGNTAFARSGSKFWKPRLRAYPRGADIRVVGSIRDVRERIVWVELVELKHPRN